MSDHPKYVTGGLIPDPKKLLVWPPERFYRASWFQSGPSERLPVPYLGWRWLFRRTKRGRK